MMEHLMETNMEQTAGYGEDPHCQRAAQLIRGKCGWEDVDVHFLVGGTQANLTVICRGRCGPIRGPSPPRPAM